MNLTKLFSIVFFVIAAALAYFLYDSVNSDIENKKRIAKIEKDVIRKLELIRDAEVAFQATNGKYTADWDTLISFIDTGKIFNVVKKEQIEMLEYGAEKVTVTFDTLGWTYVKDSVFKAIPEYNFSKLPYIPGSSSNKKFELYASKVKKGNIMVDVFEAKDIDPVNPRRDETSEIFNQKPLRVGSKVDASLSGNWE
ncbi:hypothetical protein [Aureibacter tunicatorum]|uniref:Uncharacterized protein n=1 Tax=Aureibacter tunicatorum TaxID=866807 RepID=A0AAE4BRZ5_9BACT|nr:hypothetical protein [Aureibacter tunicatorum]MDR6238360.1 hypothetical protein [Aureibacter tunicatorum]BDD03392.1 hypothetical protein AUTU_08750 [Aureibacter tunicatorum]